LDCRPLSSRIAPFHVRTLNTYLTDVLALSTTEFFHEIAGDTTNHLLDVAGLAHFGDVSCFAYLITVVFLALFAILFDTLVTDCNQFLTIAAMRSI
jgi:hypothetical protein